MPRLPPLPKLSWTPEGVPRSEDVGDVYFSGDGLAEKRAVFLAGCGLPEAWAGRGLFVIGELGFGAGINLLAAWELWRRKKPKPNARLHVVSVEGALMAAADASRIHSLWPELGELSAELCCRWPVRARGLQRIDLSDGVTLTLMIDDVAAALAAIEARIDAWFLDGFAPAKNPEMWSAETLAHVARLSAPGARLASYAVAGDVRRNLEAVGFRVEKKPGHGRKKERLEARFTGPTASRNPISAHPDESWDERGGAGPETAVIIGAGVAGARAARGLLDRGAQVTVLDAGASLGAGASGNPLALVMPRLDAADGPTARALISAFLLARRRWLTLPNDAARPLDATRLPGSDTERVRFARLLADPPLDEALLAALDPGDPSAGLVHRDSVAVRPAAALPILLRGAELRFGVEVASVSTDEAQASVQLTSGETIAADLVVVCAGMGLGKIAGLAAPPLEGRLGQLEHIADGGSQDRAIADGGYVLEAFGDLVFGSTFEAAPEGEPPITDAARAENLATLQRLRPELSVENLGVTSRAAVRATTPDRLPFSGSPPTQNEKAPGLTPAPSSRLRLIGGLGARGYLWAPLLAELVVSEAFGEPSPVEKSVRALLDPARFAARAVRRR